MTIEELLAERPHLRAAADILIRGGTHVDDVMRALMALPGSSGAAIERPIAFNTPMQSPASPALSVAPRRRTAAEITQLWDRAMQAAMARMGVAQAQPMQPAQPLATMLDQPPRSRNVSAMWDKAMAKAMSHLERRVG